MKGSFPPHLRSLNPRQRDAASTLEGPLLILAGAGSGKTRVLTHRLAHFLYSGVDPKQILALTFTNKAAEEMRHRAQRLIGGDVQKVQMSTFHSSCVRWLRREAPLLGYSRSFAITDTDDQLRLLKELLKQLELDPREHRPRGYLSLIDWAKNRGVPPEGLEEARGEELAPRAEQIFRLYNQRLRRAQAMDFNDLILLCVRLFREHPEVLARYQQRYRYLMVDEYQDTNQMQYRLIRLLSQAHRNLAVVGDDDQSIYAFRGANVHNILNFEKDYPEARVVVLDQNYRSSEAILQAATAVVQHNTDRKEKVLWTDRGEGERLALLRGRDEDEEAQKVAQSIAEKVRAGRPPGDIAIIYRTNARSRAFEMALNRHSIPCQVVGARRFFERKEIKDLMAYLRVVLNPSEESGLLRALQVPRRGVGGKTIEGILVEAEMSGCTMLEAMGRVAARGGRGRKALQEFRELIEGAQASLSQVSPAMLLSSLAEESGYLAMLRAEGEEGRDRLQNVEALIQDLSHLGNKGEENQSRLLAFLDEVSLSGQSDELPSEGGSVTLLTTHLAKGLEFPVVYVVAMVEGSFPHALSQQDEELAEERRLVYVAFTRAMEQLILSTHARRRSWTSHSYEPVRSSRFLADIPPQLLSAPSTSGGGRMSRASRSQRRQAYAQRFQAPGRPRSPSGSRLSAGTAEEQPLQPPEHYSTRSPEGAEDFQVGSWILHPRLGLGCIRRSSGSGRSLRLAIEFQNGGTKQILPAFIPSLEMVESE